MECPIYASTTPWLAQLTQCNGWAFLGQPSNPLLSLLSLWDHFSQGLACQPFQHQLCRTQLPSCQVPNEGGWLADDKYGDCAYNLWFHFSALHFVAWIFFGGGGEGGRNSQVQWLEWQETALALSSMNTWFNFLWGEFFKYLSEPWPVHLIVPEMDKLLMCCRSVNLPCHFCPMSLSFLCCYSLFWGHCLKLIVTLLTFFTFCSLC